MKKKYRLTHGKFHVPTADGGVVTYKSGQVIELTDAQAQLLRMRIEGPVSDELSVGVMIHAGHQGAASTNSSQVEFALPTSPEGKANEDVKGNYDQMRDIIRAADKDYLSALQNAEAARQGGPRPSVLQMIEKRQKGLAEPAA